MGRKFRTLVMPFILKNLWYVNEGEKQNNMIFSTADFVRFSQIEKMLKNALTLDGDIAELGVNKGRLTKLIASVMEETESLKKLILFDTFCGFNELDVKYEEQMTGKKVSEDFSNTSVEIVKNKISKVSKRVLSNTSFRVGKFPDTLIREDRKKKYCFISIDFDLYVPTRYALDILWPNLTNGGYMVIHDYGNKKYSGVKQAVDYFCEENGIVGIELADYCGTFIIRKGK